MHFERPQPEPFEHLFVFAELTRAKDADLDLPRQSSLEQLFELSRPFVEGRVRVADMTHPDHPRAAASALARGHLSDHTDGERDGSNRQQ